MTDYEMITPEAIQSYLKGAPPQTEEFAFLIGAWRTTLSRHAPDGSVMITAPGSWKARWLHEGRMLMDEFHAFAPDGGPQIAYMSTLRTFDPVAARWEMTFLLAHQPPVLSRFHGRFENGEMRLLGEGAFADGKAFQVRVRFFDISKEGFTWTDHVSLDDGASWSHNSTISAVRDAQAGAA